jgi:hypothetical protein
MTSKEKDHKETKDTAGSNSKCDTLGGGIPGDFFGPLAIRPTNAE